MAVTGKDREGWVQKRRGRYLAQILTHFEQNVEPLLDPEVSRGAVQDFKGMVRARMNALAVDCLDLMALEQKGLAQSELGQAQRDELEPTGHP